MAGYQAGLVLGVRAGMEAKRRKTYSEMGKGQGAYPSASDSDSDSSSSFDPSDDSEDSGSRSDAEMGNLPLRSPKYHKE